MKLDRWALGVAVEGYTILITITITFTILIIVITWASAPFPPDKNRFLSLGHFFKYKGKELRPLCGAL